MDAKSGLDKETSPWNSLEAAKLVASLMTPIIIAVVGFYIQTALAEQNNRARLYTLLAERRYAIFAKVSKPLNRIYCYVEEVGRYKEDTPFTVIEFKRGVDEQMFINEAVWSPETIAAYRSYASSAFKQYGGGVASDAQIRTTAAQKTKLTSWQDVWNGRFTNEKAADHAQAYRRLLDAMAADLGYETRASRN